MKKRSKHRSMKNYFEITIYSNGSKSQFQILDDTFSIGTSHEAEVVLEGVELSAFQASVKLNGEFKVLVKDLNSNSGTFVNNRLLEPDVWYELKDSDCLTFGKTQYKISVESKIYDEETLIDSNILNIDTPKTQKNYVSSVPTYSYSNAALSIDNIDAISLQEIEKLEKKRVRIECGLLEKELKENAANEARLLIEEANKESEEILLNAKIELEEIEQASEILNKSKETILDEIDELTKQRNLYATDLAKESAEYLKIRRLNQSESEKYQSLKNMTLALNSEAITLEKSKEESETLIDHKKATFNLIDSEITQLTQREQKIRDNIDKLDQSIENLYQEKRFLHEDILKLEKKKTDLNTCVLELENKTLKLETDLERSILKTQELNSVRIEESIEQANDIISEAQNVASKTIENALNEAQKLSDETHNRLEKQNHLLSIEKEEFDKYIFDRKNYIEKRERELSSLEEITYEQIKNDSIEAEKLREDILDTAKSEADQILLNIGEYKKETLELKEKTIDETRTNCETLIQEAKDSAETILDEASLEKNKIIDAAIFEKNDILEKTKQEILALENEFVQKIESEKLEKNKMIQHLNDEIDKLNVELDHLQAEYTNKSESLELEITNLKDQKLSELENDIESRKNVFQTEVDKLKEQEKLKLIEIKKAEEDSIAKERTKLMSEVFEEKERVFNILKSDLNKVLYLELSKIITIEHNEQSLKKEIERISSVVPNILINKKGKESLSDDFISSISMGQSKSSKFTFKLFLGLGFIMSLFALHLYDTNFYKRNFDNLIGKIKLENKAQKHFLNSVDEKRQAQPKFEPVQTKSYKSTYTENVLYTTNYEANWNERSYQKAWTSYIADFFINELRLPEQRVVMFLSLESKINRELFYIRSKTNYHNQNEKVELMYKTEKKLSEKFKGIVGNDASLKLLEKKKASFYQNFYSL